MRYFHAKTRARMFLAGFCLLVAGICGGLLMAILIEAFGGQMVDWWLG